MRRWTHPMPIVALAALVALGAAAGAWAIPAGPSAGRGGPEGGSSASRTEVIPVEPVPSPLASPQGPASAAAPAAPGSHSEPRINLSPYFPEWAQQEVHGNAIWQLLAAAGFVLLGVLVKKVSDIVIRRRLARVTGKEAEAEPHVLLRSIWKPLGFLFLLGGLGGAVEVLSLPAAPVNVQSFAHAALKVLLVADLVWFLFRAVDLGVLYLSHLADRKGSKLDDRMVPLVRKSLKVVIGVLCAVWVVQLLDYSVSSLLAGLGIGALAVALALQDTLANFFGSVFIFLDRPFRLGDQVRIGDVEGTVEDIGLRSTRIRTWPETLVSIPNKTVAAATIDNLSRMPRRRVVQTVGLTFKTTPEQMEQAVAALREILAADEGVAPGGILVRFTDFTATNFGITVQYFTWATDLAGHLATKERVNLAILRQLRDLGLSVG